MEYGDGEKMAVTIHDIAKQAGVSSSTVSRALNNKDNISEETKRLIHGIAEKLGYSPNRVARGLATRETKSLGLVMPTTKCLGHTLFCAMLSGIYREVQRLGYSLSFTVVDIEIQGEEEAIGKLKEYCVDGLLLGWFKEKYMEESQLVKLAQGRTPFVVIGDRHLSSQSINMIACDNFLGAYKITKHLIDLGHEKIAVIRNLRDTPITIDRLAGYNAALKQAGIHYSRETRQQIIQKIDMSKSAGGEIAMNSLLANGAEFTAVFSFGDEFAAEAIRLIQQRGYQVPGDYAVVGFDGTEYGRLLNPSLTTVEQPYSDIGKKAVQMLNKLINTGNLAKNRVLVEPKLIIRKSCGASK